MSFVVSITFLHSSNKSIKFEKNCVWVWDGLGMSILMTTFSFNEIQVGKSDSNYVKLYTSACQTGIKNSTNSQRIFKWDVSMSGCILPYN